MHHHQQLIDQFYQSFSKGDWKTMQQCYHDEAVFFDPVFQNLDATEVRAMWRMLISRASHMQIKHHSVHADEEYGGCKWEADYTFTKTGRKVNNRITAHFKFYEDKIVEHMDDFSVWRWSRQALGLPGFLLGWSGVIRNKVHKQARRQLDKFLKESS